jgi:nicotinamidase-related amidase
VTQALVIVDVQRGMFAFPEMQPYDGAGTVARIRAVLDKAHASGAPVFFVQHAGQAGHPLEPGKPGFAIHPDLTPDPAAGDSVTVKRHCNAFQDTDLERRLRAAGATLLTVCGMQTQYCVDTFVRAAADRGFGVHLIADGHTSFDTGELNAAGIVAHHNATLDGEFATLVAASAVDFGG